jgi:hypothetical protein
MADTDVPETSYGQQQDAGIKDLAKELTTATGDIRDLYAYYRFSDHEMTSITLKGKVFKKEEVWFEGHMDWTFRGCFFKEKFHFGVEGDRLEEDTRETDVNQEPFPPYGNNGLHFTQCKFTETFEIRDNCNVIFHQCTFEADDPIEIGENCRVEFIECDFEVALTFEDYCDVKFRRCTFDETDSHFVKATNHCKIYVDQCDLSNAPEDVFFEVDTDCLLNLNNSETLSADMAKAIVAKNNSHVRAYNMAGIMATTGVTITLESDSKFEAHEVDVISSGQANCLEITDSEFFMRDGQSLSSGTGTTMVLDNARVRCTLVENITAGQGTCIDATDSKVYVNGAISVTCGQGTCLLGDATSFEFNDVITVSSGQGTCMILTGQARSYFRNVHTVISGQGTCLQISEDHEIYFGDTTTISSGSGVAVDLNSARFENLGGADITGTLGGISATDSKLRVNITGNIFGGESGIGVELSSCTYDLRSIDNISGNGALSITESKGILTSIGTINGGQGVGVTVSGCSGPTEWDDIDTITSDQAKAMVVSGALKQFRILNVGSITSEKAMALDWQQDSGEVQFDHIGEISSQNEMAFSLEVDGGQFWSTDIATLESQQSFAFNGQIKGSVKAREWASITSQQGKAAFFHVSETGEVYVSDVDEITSQQDDALNLTVLGSAKARFKALGTVESQQGDALLVTANGNADVAFWDVTSALTSQEGDGANVTLSGRAVATFRAVQGFESSEGIPLKVQASDASRCYVVEVLSECTTEQETAWDLSVLGDSIIDIREASGVSSTEGDAVVVTASGTSTARFEKIGSIESTEGKAVSVTTADTSKVSFLHLDSVESTEGDGMDLNIGEGTELFVRYVPSIKSTEGVAVNGTSEGRTLLRDVDAIETTEGQAVVLDGGGSTGSFVELRDIGTITASEPSGDLVSITATAHIRLVNIPTLDAGTTSGYIAYLQSNGAGLGKIELVDVVNFTASECQGGVHLHECGDVQMHCTSEKGTVVADTGSEHLVYAHDVSGVIANYASFENTDGSLNGVYADGCPYMRLENIDSVRGKKALHAHNCTELFIVNCPSWTAPDSGETSVHVDGVIDLHVLGDQTTVVEAQDQDTKALDILNGEGITTVEMTKVDVTASKGKVSITDSNVHLKYCNLNGSVSFEKCTGEAIETTLTCGFSLDQCQYSLYNSTIDLGANDGPDKTLTLNSCVFYIYDSELTGEEEVNITNSVFEAIRCSTPLVGAETWSVTGSVVRGVYANWDAGVDAVSDSVLQFSKVTSEKKVTLTGSSQVLEGSGFDCDELDLAGNDSSVVLNRVQITGDLSSGAMAALIINNGQIGGTTELDTHAALLVNNAAFENVSTEAESALLLNRVEVAASENAGSSSFLVNRAAGDEFIFGDDCGVVSGHIVSDEISFGNDASWVDVGSEVAYTTFGENAGLMFAGSELDQFNVGRYSGVVGSRWDSSGGDAVIGDGSGVIIARSTFSDNLTVYLTSGVISARSEGGIVTGSGDIGVITARHNSELTCHGDKIGLICARQPHNINMQNGGAALLASLEGRIQFAGSVVGADLDEVDGCPQTVVAKGDKIQSGTDAIGVGITDMVGSNFTTALAVGCGATGEFKASDGVVLVGGSFYNSRGDGDFLSVGADGLLFGGGDGGLMVGGTASMICDKGVAFIGSDGTGGIISGGGALHVGGTKNAASSTYGGGVCSVGVTGYTRVYPEAGGIAVGCTGDLLNQAACLGVGGGVSIDHGYEGYTAVSSVAVGNTPSTSSFGGRGTALTVNGTDATQPGVVGKTGAYFHRDYAWIHNNWQELAGDSTSIQWGTAADKGELAMGGADVTVTALNAIDIGATNYGIDIHADSSANGDITIDAANDLLLQSAGDHSSVGGTAPTHSP